jgi:hypothetical protein
MCRIDFDFSLIGQLCAHFVLADDLALTDEGYSIAALLDLAE